MTTRFCGANGIKKQPRIETPQNPETQLIDFPSLLQTIGGVVCRHTVKRPSCRMPADTHHIYWEADDYRRRPYESLFRCVGVHKIKMARCMHDDIHRHTEPPVKPPADMMHHRLDSWNGVSKAILHRGFGDRVRPIEDWFELLPRDDFGEKNIAFLQDLMMASTMAVDYETGRYEEAREEIDIFSVEAREILLNGALNVVRGKQEISYFDSKDTRELVAA